MKRDLKKAVQEYDKRYSKKDSGEGAFYASDIIQIKEMSEGNTAANLLFDAISNALKAGFMIGYRKALRDLKKQAAK